jgi:pilus assembly protein Flp/PilA
MSLVPAIVRQLTRGEEGATMVEYGLMLALIAIICILAVATVGTNASTIFSNVANSI